MMLIFGIIAIFALVALTLCFACFKVAQDADKESEIYCNKMAIENAEKSNQNEKSE